MSNQKKLLCLALLLLLAVWIHYGGRRAIFLGLLASFAIMALGLAQALYFYFVSDSTHAKVIGVRAVDRPDADGYRNRTYYMMFQYTVENREYHSGEIADLIERPLGDIVKVRYRRNDPQDMYYNYWSSLWVTTIVLAVVAAGIYITSQ